MLHRILLISLTLFLFSCKKEISTSNPLLYMQAVQDQQNGLHVAKTIGSYSYDLQYKPSCFIALKERQGKVLSRESFEKRVADLAEMDYFTFKVFYKDGNNILTSGLSRESDYYDRLNYLVTDMQYDFSRLAGKDTSACALYHFERNYGLAPYITLTLAFEKNPSTGADQTILFNDRLFGQGPVLLKIKDSNISNAPIFQY